MQLIIWVLPLVLLGFLLLNLLRKFGINKVTGKTQEISKKLYKLVHDKPDIPDTELYSKWLKEIDPEELWKKILIQKDLKRKTLGELSSKMWQICESMDRVIKLDIQAKQFINNSSNLGFSTVQDMAYGRQNLIKLIDQYVAEIRTKI